MTKRCKGCREVFTADRPLQVVCSYLCAMDISKKMTAKAVKADKKETKIKLDALQTKSSGPPSENQGILWPIWAKLG